MKNIFKILILILSVALIVGALVMITGAEEQKDGYVSLKIGDVTFPDMTLDDAITKVLAVSGAANNTYTEGGVTINTTNYIYPEITLLGNVKQSVVYENMDGLNSMNHRCLLTIKLNGYDYDLTGVNDAPFKTQRGGKNVTFSGEGSIRLRHTYNFQSNSGSCYYFNGQGKGIRLYSDTITTKVTTFAGSGGLTEFRNCDFDINIATNGNVTDSIFEVSTGNSGAYLNMYDCTVDVDIAISYDATAEDYKTASSYHVFNVGGTGHVYLENTYINTDGSGIRCDANGNYPSNACPAGSYAFYMLNSKLVCMQDNPTTIAYAKAKAKNDIVYTNLISAGNSATGDIYFKDSYVSAGFRMIQGFGTSTAEANSSVARIITFDNTTIENERKSYDLSGMQWNKSGQGIFKAISYANFINGSRIITNGTGFSAGGSADSSTLAPSYQLGANGTNTSTGTNAHTVDLAEGTRLSSNNVSIVDIPAGCTVVYDPTGDLECPYVIKKTTDKVLDGSMNSYSITRGIGFYEDNVDFAGRNGVHIWTLPTSTDTGYSNNVSATFADGKITTSNSSYPNINGGDFAIGNTSPYSVIIYQFDFMTFDNTIPLKITYNGTASGTRQIELFRITENGESNKGAGVAPGKWNTYMTVLDAATRKTFTYLNGELVLEKSFDADVNSVKEMRIELGVGTHAEGGKIAFSNIRKVAMNKGDYLDSTNAVTADNAELYLEYFAYPQGDSNLVGGIMVGNTAYDSLNEALLAAQAKGAHVTLYADCNTVENITAWGWVNTNGYKINNKTTDLETEAYAGGICYVKPTYIDLSFYTGTAADPSQDAENLKTVTFVKGGKFYIPDSVTVPTIEVDGGLLYLAGWLKGEYINPTAYSTADEYLAAVAGKTLVDVSAEQIAEEATYYPVYSLAAYTITAGSTELYFALGDELADAINETAGSIKIKLYSDITANKAQSAGAVDGTYLRRDAELDLNGKRLTYSSQYSLMYAASGGSIAVYSSERGGELIHLNSAKSETSAAMYSSHSTFAVTLGGKAVIGDYGNASGENLTIYSSSVLAQYSASNTSNAVTVEGGTYVRIGSSKNAMFELSKAEDEINVSNATIIDASATVLSDADGVNTIFKIAAGSTLNLDNCDIITNGGKAKFVDLSSGSIVNLAGCMVAGTLETDNGEIVVDDNTVAYKVVGDNVKTADENKIFAYANTPWSGETVTYKVTRPVVGTTGLDLSRYVYVTNDPTFEADDAYSVVLIPDMNVKAAFASDCEEYSWRNLSYEVFMKTWVLEGSDPLDFAHLVTPLVPTEELDTLVLGASDLWTLSGNTLTPGKRAVGVVPGFRGYVDLTLGSTFGIYFYVAEEYYGDLDADTKSLFSDSAIKIGDSSYRMAKSVKHVKANEAFEDAVYEITLSERGYSFTLTYAISIYDYIAGTFATEGLGDEAYKLAYYLGEYLADVYGTYDEEGYDSYAAILEALVNSNSSFASSEDIILPEHATNMGTAAEKVKIELDLKGTPTYKITSSVDGVVTWGGSEVLLTAGEAVRLTADAGSFDGVLTFSLSDGSIGSFCYGDYVESLGDGEGAQLAKSFYNYIVIAKNYR